MHGAAPRPMILMPISRAPARAGLRDPARIPPSRRTNVTIPPARRAAPARIGALAAAAAAVVLSVGIGAPAAHAAADPALQPAPTASDHLITDVPGLVNGRELGAFTGVDGRTVAASRLIRTESLDKITAAGAATLATAHHVDLVIDLRTPGQIQAKPDVPIPGAKTVAISMFGADGDYPDDTVMYRDLIDKGRVDAALVDEVAVHDRVVRVVAVGAEHRDGDGLRAGDRDVGLRLDLAGRAQVDHEVDVVRGRERRGAGGGDLVERLRADQPARGDRAPVDARERAELAAVDEAGHVGDEVVARGGRGLERGVGGGVRGGRADADGEHHGGGRRGEGADARGGGTAGRGDRHVRPSRGGDARGVAQAGPRRRAGDRHQDHGARCGAVHERDVLLP